MSVSECIICRSSLAPTGQAVADRVTHVAVTHYGVSERATACITMTPLSGAPVETLSVYLHLSASVETSLAFPVIMI